MKNKTLMSDQSRYNPIHSLLGRLIFMNVCSCYERKQREQLQFMSASLLLISLLLKNKAGYTAKTSRWWVGRGENTRFHTIGSFSTCAWQLERDGPTDGRTKPLIELLVRDLKPQKQENVFERGVVVLIRKFLSLSLSFTLICVELSEQVGKIGRVSERT